MKQVFSLCSEFVRLMIEREVGLVEERHNWPTSHKNSQIITNVKLNFHQQLPDIAHIGSSVICEITILLLSSMPETGFHT